MCQFRSLTLNMRRSHLLLSIIVRRKCQKSKSLAQRLSSLFIVSFYNGSDVQETGCRSKDSAQIPLHVPLAWQIPQPHFHTSRCFCTNSEKENKSQKAPVISFEAILSLLSAHLKKTLRNHTWRFRTESLC